MLHSSNRNIVPCALVPCALHVLWYVTRVLRNICVENNSAYQNGLSLRLEADGSPFIPHASQLKVTSANFAGLEGLHFWGRGLGVQEVVEGPSVKLEMLPILRILLLRNVAVVAVAAVAVVAVLMIVAREGLLKLRLSMTMQIRSCARTLALQPGPPGI